LHFMTNWSCSGNSAGLICLTLTSWPWIMAFNEFVSLNSGLLKRVSPFHTASSFPKSTISAFFAKSSSSIFESLRLSPYREDQSGQGSRSSNQRFVRRSNTQSGRDHHCVRYIVLPCELHPSSQAHLLLKRRIPTSIGNLKLNSRNPTVNLSCPDEDQI
jgi:hypothetical protein